MNVHKDWSVCMYTWMAVVPRMLSKSTGKAFPSLRSNYTVAPVGARWKLERGKGERGDWGGMWRRWWKSVPLLMSLICGCQDERQAWNRAQTVPWPGYSLIIIDLSQTEVHCCFDIALMWGIESKIAGQGSTSCSILPWCQSANLDNS